MITYKTACPLDCYDGCSVEVTDDGKLKGDKEHPFTQGFLCPFLNHYKKYERIEKPRLNGKEISMGKALAYLVETLKNSNNTLHYRGHGNFGKMQEVTDQFFSQYGAALTEGSLCDAAGEHGILEGRGANYMMSEDQISKSEVVIFWGRNPKSTNSHILPFIKGKKIVVIDPIKTDFAKNADFHIQIRPREDLYLALLLSRYIFNEDMADYDFLDSRCSGIDKFEELIYSIHIKNAIKQMDISLEEIDEFLHLIKGKKVAILVGVGVQKFSIGSSVLRAIDSFAATLGLFGKEGCGVSYLGSSSVGLNSPFKIVKSKKEKAAIANFDKYDTLFVQGSNPLSQMPSTKSVDEKLSKVKNIIYFGIYENETSAKASLVIPAKTFLEKDDIRTSYGHNYILKMPRVEESNIGIGEYDLANYLTKEFKQDSLEDEEFYIKYYEEQSENSLINGRDDIAYANDFTTDDGKFLLIDKADDYPLGNDGYFLVTAKSSKSLNSQFERETKAYFPSSAGIEVGQSVSLKSKYGEATFEADIHDGLRDDSILIYSGTPNVNYLTPNRTDNSGTNAIYQEVKVFID